MAPQMVLQKHLKRVPKPLVTQPMLVQQPPKPPTKLRQPFAVVATVMLNLATAVEMAPAAVTTPSSS
jgi:hypothetical protein